MYYEDNFYTSVYFFDTRLDNGFGSCWLVKKFEAKGKDIQKAEWDAIHIVTTNIDPNFNKAEYLVNTTVFLTLDAENAASYGALDVGCSVLRIKKEQKTINVKPEEMQGFHLGNIGRMIEENETAIRSDLYNNYINKAKQIINSNRLGYGNYNGPSDFQKEL